MQISWIPSTSGGSLVVSRTSSFSLFPNYASQLPDQAIRDSLCWASEASRILTPANFQHSIVLGASVCSRLLSAYLSWNRRLIAQWIRYIIASSSFTRFPCQIWEILRRTLWRSVIVCIENYQRVIDWHWGHTGCAQEFDAYRWLS